MLNSRILVIGATGYIGKFVALAGVSLQHHTFALVRPSTIVSKPDAIASLKSAGITILEGSLDDHDSLVAALKQVDIVISLVAFSEVLNQTKIISAIKEIGNIKRFLPSEYGNDFDHHNALEPAKTVFNHKAQIRRAVEEAGIPYTYIVSYGFAGYFLHNLLQPDRTEPPRDKVLIYGSGDVKIVASAEEDVATFTIKAIDDPRTLNKSLHIRPKENIFTQNELVELWEKKIGKVLEKQHVPAEKIVKEIEATPFPNNLLMAISHDVLIQGAQENVEFGPGDVEASSLYPEVKYTTVDEYLNRYV